MPLVTGKAWFKVSEMVNIYLTGVPRPGIGGKDVILYIMELKQNTVASDWVVEFTGHVLQYLSCDTRFAIANMCTVCVDPGSPGST
jgi:homoaconitase/3-isopropylmalate dehydratase large subunit